MIASRRTDRLAIVALFTGSMLASCGGGGGSSSLLRPLVPTAAPSPSAFSGSAARAVTGTLSLYFPPKNASAKRRGRLFLSPSASSVSIAVTGEPNVVADISSSSPQCSSASPAPAPSPGAMPSTRTCAITVLAPVGNDTFTATLYDGANATGTALGTGSATQAISTSFTVQIGVMGITSSIAVTVGPATFTMGTAGTATVSVAAYDADGNLISGTYENPIALTNTDSSGTFTLSTAVVSSSPATVGLTYSGAATPADATISATATGVAAANVTPQTVTAVPPNLYTAEYDPAAITVTPDDASGNVAPGRSIDTTSAGLMMLLGMAVDGRGLLYVSGQAATGEEEEVGGQAEIAVFAAGANAGAQPVRTIATTSLASSLAIDSAYDIYAATPDDAAVDIYAPNVSGSAPPSNTISAEGMNEPVGVALDANGAVYVANDGGSGDNAETPGSATSDAVFAFSAGAGAGATPSRIISGPDTGLATPENLTVDASGAIYVANGGDGGEEGAPGSVTIYAPGANGDALPQRTISGSLTTLSFPYGIAVDAAGYVYVADSNDNSILVFAPGANGNVAPVRTISGDATGIGSPSQMVLAP